MHLKKKILPFILPDMRKENVISVLAMNFSIHMSPIRLNLVQIGNKIFPEVLFSQVNDTENLDVFESCLHEVLKSKIVWSKLRRKDILEQLLKIFGVFSGISVI